MILKKLAILFSALLVLAGSASAQQFSDEEYRARLEQMDSFITLPYNNVVKNLIVSYSEKNRKGFGKVVALADLYMPIFEETLDFYGLPQELKVMSIIESRLNLRATSPVGAKGLWQFTYRAGRHYGLRINSFVDERMDLYKSTDAAARYLRDAYAAFGDWTLAICAYNCGYGGVRKAINRAGGKKDFWSIYPYLPNETRNYVPAFVAALYTMYYREELGIDPAELSMPDMIDTVHVKTRVHLEQVSELSGISLSTLRTLNPSYLYDIIPGDKGAYILYLPSEQIEDYLACENQIPLYNTDKYFPPSVVKDLNNNSNNRITYKVKSGDCLGTIAKKHGVTVSKLKSWNNLKSDNLRIGQTLYIFQ